LESSHRQGVAFVVSGDWGWQERGRGQFFGGRLLQEPDSEGFDAASKHLDAGILRGARRSKIKGFLQSRALYVEEQNGNREAGTEWKDAGDEGSRGDSGGRSNRTGV